MFLIYVSSFEPLHIVVAVPPDSIGCSSCSKCNRKFFMILTLVLQIKNNYLDSPNV